MLNVVRQILLSGAVALALVTGGVAQGRREPPKKPPELPKETEKKKEENRGGDSRNRESEDKNKGKRKPFYS